MNKQLKSSLKLEWIDEIFVSIWNLKNVPIYSCIGYVTLQLIQEKILSVVILVKKKDNQNRYSIIDSSPRFILTINLQRKRNRTR